jgi:translation initiation factor IF-2
MQKRSDDDKPDPPSSRHNANFSPPVIQTDPRLQRDVAPHQDTRAAHKRPRDNSFFNRPDHQYRRTTEHASSSQPLPSSRTVNQASKETESVVHKTYFAVEPASFEWTKDRDNRNGRPHRTTHKERGSLLSQMDQEVAVPRHLQPDNFQKRPKTERKGLVEKRVSLDVYIPTTVSVGTLARLLGVRLGKSSLPEWYTTYPPLSEHLQHKMRQAGMIEEAKYDHGSYSSYNRRSHYLLDHTHISLDLRLCGPPDRRIWPKSDSQ